MSLQRTLREADVDLVGELRVNRWARYGHDRLYVQTADGTRLGYWCLQDRPGGRRGRSAPRGRRGRGSGLQGHTCGPGRRPGAGGARRSARAPAGGAHLGAAGAPARRAAAGRSSTIGRRSHAGTSRAGPAPNPAPVEPPDDEDTPAAPSWTDLGLNRPGQAAREQAIAHRQAAPMRMLFARVLGVHTDERAWRIGADGEQAVAARLAKLGPEWKVLHAVPVGDRGSDIDHVVIGPAGVFTVNAKHHPHASVWVGGNKFMVNGHRQPYVRNSRHEAQRASRLLTAACGFPVNVTGLIAVMGAHEGFTVKEQPPGGDVHVMTRKDVHRWLRRRDTGVLGPG